MRAATIMTAALLATSGCGSDAPPGPPPAAPPQALQASAPEPWTPSPDPKEARFLGLAAPKPATWIEHPPSVKMRKAQYTVPARDGHDAAHVVVYHLGPGGGGTVEANIERWRHQFEPDADGLFPEPLVETFEADGMPVTLVELAGNWMKMGAGWYTADQVFLAAIVEAPIGPVFVRFAGDAATVDANRDDFVTMMRGLRQTG